MRDSPADLDDDTKRDLRRDALEDERDIQEQEHDDETRGDV